MRLAPEIAVPGIAGALRSTPRTVRPEPADPDRGQRGRYRVLLDCGPEIAYHALRGISRVHCHMFDPPNSCLTYRGLGLARQFVDRRLGLVNGVLRHILGCVSGLLCDLDGLLREPLRVESVLDRVDGLAHFVAGDFDFGDDHLRVGISSGPGGATAPAIGPHM